MSQKTEIILVRIALAFFVLVFFGLNWHFTENQRWMCTHILECGCGPGYKAVYHGRQKPITCALDASK